MGNVVIWALLTGGITGAIWAAIVLVGRYRRMEGERLAMVEELEQRLDDHEAARERIAELEERLDLTEHLLVQQHQSNRLPPSLENN